MLLLKVIKSGQNRLRLFNPLFMPQARASEEAHFWKRCHPKSDFQWLWQAVHFSTKSAINKPWIKQNNLVSSSISLGTSSRKRQLKTSQDDTKPCQLQRSVSKSPDAAWIFRMNSPVKFWPIRAWKLDVERDQGQKRLPSLHVKAGRIFASEISLNSKF